MQGRTTIDDGVAYQTFCFPMSGFATDLFPSWNDVIARREWEVGFAMERLERMEAVDLPLCRIERISA